MTIDDERKHLLHCHFQAHESLNFISSLLAFAFFLLALLRFLPVSPLPTFSVSKDLFHKRPIPRTFQPRTLLDTHNVDEQSQSSRTSPSIALRLLSSALQPGHLSQQYTAASGNFQIGVPASMGTTMSPASGIRSRFCFDLPTSVPASGVLPQQVAAVSVNIQTSAPNSRSADTVESQPPRGGPGFVSRDPAYVSSSSYPMSQSLMVQGDVQAEILSSSIGAAVGCDALRGGLTDPPFYLSWPKRTTAVRESRGHLSEVDKIVIRCLRGDENNGPMPYARIEELTSFPKVTISRVVNELKGRQLPGHVKQAVISIREEDGLVNVQDPQGPPVFWQMVPVRHIKSSNTTLFYEVFYLVIPAGGETPA
ncbi:MAG: hypothetical protein J3Q66DRAFT_374711 [Benniella sp.]|nr:MAG: hypothetical protein J3Q66DRAFT_374711 [Benniella sp.]